LILGAGIFPSPCFSFGCRRSSRHCGGYLLSSGANGGMVPGFPSALSGASIGEGDIHKPGICFDGAMK
ncbi:MAG: hypothetical protein ACLRVT_10320, partial [Oscillospiraceae bacterium]